MACNKKTFESLTLGFIFVCLGSCRVLVIKFSANEEKKYDYLPVTVNVCAELLKFIVCFSLSLSVYSREGTKLKEVVHVNKGEFLQLFKWAIPGLLYFIDNLLTYYIIQYFNPAVVVLLGNFVIITTSILFRIVLRRKLTQIQWAALIILFLAIICLSNQSQTTVTLDHTKHHMINHVIQKTKPSGEPSICQSEETQFAIRNNITGQELLSESIKPIDIEKENSVFNFNLGHVLILLQCFVASLANIYNEKIFKEGDAWKDSIYIQNSKLYFFGILFNASTLIVHSVYREKIYFCGFFHGHNVYSVLLIFLTAFHGLNVALILKFRDNMFHLLSSQIITVTVITASIYFFKFSPKLEFFVSAPIVLVSIYIFKTAQAKVKVRKLPQTHSMERQDDDVVDEMEELITGEDTH